MQSKKANILTENLIFIILNIVFIAILLVFVFTKLGSAAVLEEKYAKEIALIIDSAELGMVIELNMEDAFDVARKNGMPLDSIVSIHENIVTVKLGMDRQGYSYSFFNDMEINEPYVSGENYVFAF